MLAPGVHLEERRPRHSCCLALPPLLHVPFPPHALCCSSYARDGFSSTSRTGRLRPRHGNLHWGGLGGPCPWGHHLAHVQRSAFRRSIMASPAFGSTPLWLKYWGSVIDIYAFVPYSQHNSTSLMWFGEDAFLLFHCTLQYLKKNIMFWHLVTLVACTNDQALIAFYLYTFLIGSMALPQFTETRHNVKKKTTWLSFTYHNLRHIYIQI